MTFDDPEGSRKHHSAGQRQAKVQRWRVASPLHLLNGGPENSKAPEQTDVLLSHPVIRTARTHACVGHRKLSGAGLAKFFSGKSQTVKICYIVTAPGLCRYGTDCAKSPQSCPTL